MARKSNGRGKKPGRRHAPAAAVSVLPAAGAPPHDAAGTVAFVAIATCFLVSGTAALIYQTAWSRLFAIALGTSELAIALVLAAYMGGLALGARLASGLVPRLRRPLLAFALLELGIGALGVASPWLLQATTAVYEAIAGGQPGPVSASGLTHAAFFLGTAVVVLVVPTLLMGATLPVLAQAMVRSERDLDSRIGWLYSINTAGAVAGTLVTAFVLLPALGLRGSLWVAAGLNGLVFVLAGGLLGRLLPRRLPDEAVEQTAGGRPLPAGADRTAVAALALIALSGAVSFTYEVLWTRLLSHVLGGSITAFATMLASFLAGIALGAAVAAYYVRSRASAALAFSGTQFGAALGGAAVYGWLQSLTGAAIEEGAVLMAMVVMLPTAVFIGATFPLTVRMVVDAPGRAGAGTGSVLAWNTMGAVLGALSCAWFVMPWLGIEGTAYVAMVTNLVLGVLALMLLRHTTAAVVIAAALAGVALALAIRPDVPRVVLDAALVDPRADGELVHYGIGRSATVVLKEQDDGYFYLRTNGLPEATIAPLGAPPRHHSQQLLSAVPLALRRDARDVLVVGLGGGVAVEELPERVRRIDVVELEPEVVKANTVIGARRLIDPLRDPRVAIIVNDARHALRLTDARYDLIVSQPSHPWTAGASHLYTREFAALARRHLVAGGVFAQWLNAGFIDIELLRSVTATLAAEFPFVQLYRPEPLELLFVASDAPLTIGAWSARDARYLERRGLNAPEDLLAMLALDNTGVRNFAAGAALVTDDRNRLATDSRACRRGSDASSLWLALAPHDPLIAGRIAAFWTPPGAPDMAYVGVRIASRGMSDRADAIVSTLRGDSSGSALEAELLARERKLDAVEHAALTALAANPNETRALYALLGGRLAQVARGQVPEWDEYASRLPRQGQAVIAGYRAALAEDWPRLRELDAELATTRSTDPWFGQAVKLRVEWRGKRWVDLDPAATALESLELVDRALVNAPLLDLLVLRVGAGLTLGDWPLVVGTANAFATQVMLTDAGETLVRRTPTDAVTAVLWGRVTGLQSLLNSPDIPATTPGLEQARRSLTRLARRLAGS